MHFAVAEYKNRVYSTYGTNTIGGYYFPLRQVKGGGYWDEPDINHIINKFLSAVSRHIEAEVYFVEYSWMLDTVYKGLGVGIAYS